MNPIHEMKAIRLCRFVAALKQDKKWDADLTVGDVLALHDKLPPTYGETQEEEPKE